MKANKKQVKIIVAVVVVVALLAGALYFVLRPNKNQAEAKLVEMTLPGNTQNITGNIEEVKIETSMWKDVLLIKGWVFKQNVKEKNRELFLVFKSKNKIQIFDLDQDNLARPDVTKHFKMDGGTDNHGFEGYIPMKELTDTTYRIGYVIKDESGQYHSMSGKEIAISNGTVTLNDSKKTTNQISIPIQSSNAKIKYFFEQFNPAGNKLSITGWAFLEGQNTDSLKSYVVLRNTQKTAVFSVVVIPRKDVTNYFKDTRLNLDLCGFSAKVDGEELEKGKYEVCLYLVNGNKIGLTYTGKFMEIGN